MTMKHLSLRPPAYTYTDVTNSAYFKSGHEQLDLAANWFNLSNTLNYLNKSLFIWIIEH